MPCVLMMKNKKTIIPVWWTRAFYFDFKCNNLQIPWNVINFSCGDFTFFLTMSAYTSWNFEIKDEWVTIWNYWISDWAWNYKVKFVISENNIKIEQWNWWWFSTSNIVTTKNDVSNSYVDKIWSSSLFQSTIEIEDFYLTSEDISDPTNVTVWDILAYDTFDNYSHSLTLWNQISVWDWWLNFYAFWWKWWYMNNQTWWWYLNIEFVDPI